MSKVRIKSYPVKAGDCFLISYDKFNILIDTGYRTTASKLISDLKDMNNKGEKINLLILTHIDNDHIGGAIHLLDQDNIIKVDDVWYNGYKQIFDIKNDLKKVQGKVEVILNNIIHTNELVNEENGSYEVGYKEAKSLEELLFEKKIEINKAFGGEKILTGMNYEYNNDIKFYFLSPTKEIINNVKDEWKDELQEYDCYEKGRDVYNMPKAFEFYFHNSNYDEDNSIEVSNDEESEINIEKLANTNNKLDDNNINNSSLAFLLKIKDVNLLFLGDSNPDIVKSELEKLFKDNEQLKNIALMKVSHHGSKYNMTNDLLSSANISQFLISSNGAKRKGISTKPHTETIARILHNHPNAIISLNYPKNYYNTKIYDIVEYANKNMKSKAIIENGYDDEPLIMDIKVRIEDEA